MENESTDQYTQYEHPLRTPEWEISGFRFLVSTNEKRYRLSEEHYLEGMFIHYKLFDMHQHVQVGPEIILNAVRGEYHRNV